MTTPDSAAPDTIDKSVGRRRTRAVAWMALAAILLCIGYVILKSPLPTVVPNAAPLGLPRFYTGHHAVTSGAQEVQALSEPEMGWRTDGKPVPNPTRVATQGLQAVLSRDLTTARRCADWLLTRARNAEDDALSFPFQFDFIPYWPFELRAPWSSAITQGLALGLFTQLFLAEHRDDDLRVARRIAAFYHRPLEAGGFTRFEAGGAFFEEYPCAVPTRVLNGALVAMLALHDYAKTSRDASAERLLQSAVKRLVELLPEYDVRTLDAGCALSAYSLAPIRPRLLMRLTGNGKTLIHAIRFIGKRETISGAPPDDATSRNDVVVAAEVQVGENGDDNPMNPLYVWYDARAMNWGLPVTRTAADESVTGRIAGEQVGTFNHAPFVLGWLPEFAELKHPAIEIDYLPLGGAPLQATLYDGEEYWPLGVLDAAPGGRRTGRFPVPAAYPLAKATTPDPRTRIDDRYLDDNQRLLQTLADLTSNAALAQWAARWRESYIAVPGHWLNWSANAILHEAEEQPLSVDQPGSTLVGDPCVIRVGDVTHLFYLAAAPDDRRRLYLATSSDGVHWTRHGQVFADAALPFPGDVGRVSIAVIDGTLTAPRYVMAFTLTDTPGSPKNRLCVADATNADSWTFRQMLSLGDLAACTLTDHDEGLLLYCIPPPAGLQAQVLVLSSRDGQEWSAPALCLPEVPLLGSTRHLALSAFKLDDMRCLLLERASEKNHHFALYVQHSATDSDHMSPSFAHTTRGDESIRGSPAELPNTLSWLAYPQNPVYVCSDWKEDWDAVRSCWSVVEDANGFAVYYTARSGGKHNSARPAAIGRGRMEVERLRKLIKEDARAP